MQLEKDDIYTFEENVQTWLKNSEVFFSVSKNRLRRREIKINIEQLKEIIKRITEIKKYIEKTGKELTYKEDYRAINRSNNLKRKFECHDDFFKVYISFDNISDYIEEQDYPNLNQIQVSLQKDLEKQKEELEKQKEINQESAEFLD